MGSDVKARASPCKQFLLLEVKSRIIAATLEELKLESLDDEPSNDLLPQNLPTRSKQEQKKFIMELATNVVDKHIVHKENTEILLEKTRQASDRKETATNNRFNCRYQECTKTFKYDGKSRLDHEATHGLVYEIATKKGKKMDDLYNYQTSFLELGMVIINFFDAVSMGDGDRVLQCWKFMLLYLKVDGAGSRKYALESFYLMCQNYCLLSEKAAFHLRWNRFYKSRNGSGGNIPLDLALEHFNNLLKNIFRMLGPNVSNKKIIDRYCKALVVNKSLIESWDKSCQLIQRSGRHIAKSMKNDLCKIVHNLMHNHALQERPGRKLKGYPGMKPSVIQDLDMSSIFKWITEHKKKVLLGKVAR